MKYTNFLFFIFLFFVNKSFSQNGSQLFDDSYVHTIRITFFDSNFWELLTQDYDNIEQNGVKEYRQALITIDGNTLDTVGLRQKGSYSNWGFQNTLKKQRKVDINEVT